MLEWTKLVVIMPEIVILGMACICLLVTGFCGNRGSNVVYILAQLGLVIAAWFTYCSVSSPAMVLFHGNFIADPMSHILKLFVYALSFGAFLYARPYISQRDIPRGEYYTLSLFAILGMQVLISAQSLLVLYLGLEIMALPLYAMVAIQHDSGKASEAASKYFVMGALASGMMLYGISLVYGATANLNLALVFHTIHSLPPQHRLILVFGLVFLVTGLGFKFGAVPFHMWAPDVYEGAPTSVTMVIATAPKLAAFAMLVRVLHDMMPAFTLQWHQMWLVMAVLSIAIGNVVAIAQTNIKRMFAYSSIAHIGYMALGVLIGTDAGFSAAMFYIISYAVMSLGGFGLLVLLSKDGKDIDDISDLKGLNTRNPWLAFLMLLLLFSMAGIPPTVGFFAKLNILAAVVHSGYLTLAIFAMIFAVIGAYYYLRVVRIMYFEEPADTTPFKLHWDARLVISVNALLVLAMGCFPATLMQVCRAVFQLQ